KFVLSTSGHIAAMVNPPGNPKASFQTSGTNPADTTEWLDRASKVKGSWWDDYVDWLAERTGPERNKPSRMGSATYEPLCEAPGTYVHDR
ncbi:MAG: poly-beta-hydroxybutyrate polymerase, partial [Aeromicrobium sp.]